MVVTTNPARPDLDYGPAFAEIYDELFPDTHVHQSNIDWLASWTHSSARSVLEIGVGTGRLALPLAKLLQESSPGLRYFGLDVSSEMLDRLRDKDPTNMIIAISADATTYRHPEPVDTVYVLCTTISMITTVPHQMATLRNAVGSLNPGGHLLIETHNDRLVRSMHVHPETTYCVAYGPHKALVTFSRLDQSKWTVDHVWVDHETAVFRSEESRLTSREELDRYSTELGLERVGHFTNLSSEPADDMAPTVTCVYRKPLKRPSNMPPLSRKDL